MIRHVRLRVNDGTNLALIYPRKHEPRTEAAFLNARHRLDHTHFKTDETEIPRVYVCLVCARMITTEINYKYYLKPISAIHERISQKVQLQGKSREMT